MPMASFMERILARRPSTSSAVVSPTTPMVRAMSAYRSATPSALAL